MRTLERVGHIRDEVLPEAVDKRIFAEVGPLIEMVKQRLALEVGDTLLKDLEDFGKWNERTLVPNEEQRTSFRSLQKRATEVYREKAQQAWRAMIEGETDKNIIDSICQTESGKPFNVPTFFKPNQVKDRDAWFVDAYAYP